MPEKEAIHCQSTHTTHRSYKPSSSANEYLPVISPVNGETLGKVCVSNAADVEEAVAHAQEAFPAWSGLTVVRVGGSWCVVWASL